MDARKLASPSTVFVDCQREITINDNAEERVHSQREKFNRRNSWKLVTRLETCAKDGYGL